MATRLGALLVLVFVSCATTSGTSAIEEAKAVIRSHEAFARAGDLDGIMTNVAEGVVVLAPDAPLIEGRAAFRDFYAAFMKAGTFDFGHDYRGAEIVGDTVILHGVARGNFIPPTGSSSRFANNFILVMRKQPDGKFRFWRISFAPSAEKL